MQIPIIEEARPEGNLPGVLRFGGRHGWQEVQQRQGRKALRSRRLIHSPHQQEARPPRVVIKRMAEFNQEVFDTICERIADGESLRRICQDEGMPSKACVMRWLAANPAAVDQYARARELQADHEFDEIKDIVDAASPEDVQVARLRADARRWRVGKLKPKVYGDKIAVGGADDLPPIKTEDSGAAKLAAFLSDIAERSGTAGGAAE